MQLVLGQKVGLTYNGMQSAQQSIQSVIEAVGLRLKPLDKKAEKALVQAQQQDLKAQLAEQNDPAAALSLAVPLLVMQVSVIHAHTQKPQLRAITAFIPTYCE